MSNLPSKQDQFVHNGYKFSESDSKMILANKSDRIMNVPQLDARKVLTIAIRKGIQVLGHKEKSDSETLTIATDVYEYARKKFPNVKIQEIILSIELGSFREYDEGVAFISASNIIEWVREYGRRKINVFKTLAKAKEKEALKTSLNESEKKEKDYWDRFPQMVVDLFEYYKENGELDESGYRIVRGLEKIGYTPFLDIIPDAKRQIYAIERTKAIAKEKDRLEKTQVIVSMKSINVESLEVQIKDNCKQVCLKNWFESQEKIDLENIKKMIN